MSERNEQPRADVLDLAVAGLRDVPVPDGPPPGLVASTVEALRAAGHPPAVIRADERRRKMFLFMRFSGAGVAAALLVVVAGWLLLTDRTASPAFADVVKQVKDAHSVTFVTQMPTVVQGSSRGLLRQKFYVQGDAFRMELPSAQEGLPVPADAPPVLLAIVANSKHKKALQLDFVKKEARFLEVGDKQWQDMMQGMANPIEKLRQLKNEDAERVGEEVLDGRKTQVFRVKRGDLLLGLRVAAGESAKLWVDPETSLPVRIAVGDPSSKDKPFLVFDQFTWNEALAPGLFALEVPQGWTQRDK
jgi:hypothetical protein